MPWLNRITGKNFRLPSEAEWEYAARAGSTTKYSWGNDISPNQANYKDSGHEKTIPIKSYAPNAFGLYDMHGNVWEWTQDCWNDSYEGAPNDCSAWLNGDSEKRILRGGCWVNSRKYLRSTHRELTDASMRTDKRSFRLVCAS